MNGEFDLEEAENAICKALAEHTGCNLSSTLDNVVIRKRSAEVTFHIVLSAGKHRIDHKMFIQFRNGYWNLEAVLESCETVAAGMLRRLRAEKGEFN